MTVPIAHAGHWLVNVLYVAPLLVVVGVLAWQSMKDRRRVKQSGEPIARRPPTEPPPA
ncbi:MAG TPA: hypothetical protein VGR11_11440 [Solirubrobacteraceae bacterium]|nr:hypothetical protein [Solirubrobacteraceae bacterium]